MQAIKVMQVVCISKCRRCEGCNISYASGMSPARDVNASGAIDASGAC